MKRTFVWDWEAGDYIEVDIPDEERKMPTVADMAKKQLEREVR